MAIDKTWLATHTPDTEFMQFAEELQQVIANRITNQIRHSDDLQIELGPHDRGASSQTSVLFTLNMRGKLLEVAIRDRSNVRNSGPASKSPTGFYILKHGRNKIYTLPGLISYINEVWIPGQKALVRRAKNRQCHADELTEAMKGFNSTKYTQNLSPLLASIVRSWGSQGQGSIEYSLITDANGKTMLKKHQKINYYSLRNEQGDLKFIWVALKIEQNMAQVGYFFPDTVQSYNGKAFRSYRHFKSNWFSPKNFMPQLNKLAKKAPSLAALLADPNIGSK